MPNLQPVPRVQMWSALSRLVQVVDIFLEAEWLGGNLSDKVLAQMSIELFRRAHTLLARRAKILAKMAQYHEFLKYFVEKHCFGNI